MSDAPQSPLACALRGVVFALGVALVVGHQAILWSAALREQLASTMGVELPEARGVLAVVLAAGNLFFLLNWELCARERGAGISVVLIAGYLALFGMLVWLVQAPLLFALFVLLYAAVLHRPVLTGYVLLFVACFVLLAPFSLPAFVIAALGYAGVTQIGTGANSPFHAVCFAMGLLLLAVVLMPVLNLCTQSTLQTLLFTLRGGGAGSEGWEARRALEVSLLTSLASTLIVTCLGVPLAYAMTRGRFKGQRVVDLLIDVPILIPPLVVGIGLLLLLGPDSPAGALMQQWLGVRVDGTIGAIIIAQVFVSSPFLVRSAMTAFDAIDPRMERVARTLGASPRHVFFIIALPNATTGIVRGAVLSWARAISEFGSLLVIAYRPFTAPTLIYNRFTERGVSESTPIAVLLVLMCMWVFALVQFIRLRPLAAVIGRREVAQ